MKLFVDGKKCQGHGRCYALAPELFTADENGNATACAAEVPEQRLGDARIAVGNCPEGAITLLSDTDARGK